MQAEGRERQLRTAEGGVARKDREGDGWMVGQKIALLLLQLLIVHWERREWKRTLDSVRRGGERERRGEESERFASLC